MKRISTDSTVSPDVISCEWSTVQYRITRPFLYIDGGSWIPAYSVNSMARTVMFEFWEETMVPLYFSRLLAT